VQREAARTAAAKVEAALKPETRSEVSRMRERIQVSGWMQREASPWLALLQEALLANRVLHLKYHSYSPDRVTERKVEPYQLVYYENDWHLLGYCRLREGMRDFRPAGYARPRSSKKRLTVTGRRFRGTPGGLVGRAGGTCVAGRFGSAVGAGEAGVRAGAGGASRRRVSIHVPGAGCEAAHAMDPELGPAARVESPPEVVAALREQAEAMARRYGDA